MAVSDRIAILNRGRLEQLGSPAEIYRRPQSRFAAEFMGASNIIEMEVAGYDSAACLITAGGDSLCLRVRGDKPAGGRVTLSVRPEWIRVAEAGEAGGMNVFSGTVLGSTFLGSMVRYRVTGPAGSAIAIEVHAPEASGVCCAGDTLWYHIPPDRPVVLKD